MRHTLNRRDSASRRAGCRPQQAIWAILAVSLASFWAESRAVEAGPDSYLARQPDGTPLTLRLRGDEWFHYEQDPKGFTVIREKDWYVYARREPSTGHLVSSGLRVGIDDPANAGVQPGALPSAKARAELDRARLGPFASAGTESGSASAAVSANATAGTLKNLVVLIQWADHSSRTLPSPSDVDILMNHDGPHPTLAPTGSVRDVFLENSYGALILESTITPWIVSDSTELYYANANSGLTWLIHEALKDALTKIDALIDFSQFDQDADGVIDSITFLHSGYAAEWGGNDAYGRNYVDRIWSHKWSIFGGWTSQEGVTVNNYHISPAVWGTSGSNIGRIGVIAHETGHFLGLPDLYDTDASPGNGIGSFGLMANSWGFDGSQKFPPHLSPWSKIQLGWLTPTALSSPGTYILNQAESLPEALRIDLGYPSGEYLLVENRQPAGFDGSMPQGGLVIWHIDETADYNTEGYPAPSGWTGRHYRVAVLQADGDYDLEKGYNRGDSGDTWHAAGPNELTVSLDPATGPFPNSDAYQGGVFVQTQNRIFDVSAAGPSMSLSFEVLGTPPAPPAAPDNLVASAQSYESIQITWFDNASNESNFTIDRSQDGINFSSLSTISANTTSFIDSGLSPLTEYTYRVYAFNSAGQSDYSNTASAVTDAPPPPPVAPSGLAATDITDSSVNLVWIDHSSDEEAFVIRRSSDGGLTWVNAAIRPSDTTQFLDGDLAAQTTYSYKVVASNAWGESESNAIEVTTLPAPAYVDTLADLDIPVNGTVSGEVAATHASDSMVQQITEVASGGKPSRRRSFLEHRWRFSNVRGGLGVTLFVNVWASANSEGDNFLFESSTDEGSTWTPLVTIPGGTSPGTLHAAVLPSANPATTYIRVLDTDATPGNASLDSVSIDQMFLRTDLDPNDTEPVAPSELAASAVSSTEVQLNWIDNSNNERGFRILRSTEGAAFNEIAVIAVDSTSFLDTTASPNTHYAYRVEAYTASYRSSSNVAQALTPDGIRLSATGSKVKGLGVVELAWTGGSSVSTVNLWRSINGGPFMLMNSVPNNLGGSYTDNTGLKGSFTLHYQVCSAGDPATVCSQIVTVFF